MCDLEWFPSCIHLGYNLTNICLDVIKASRVDQDEEEEESKYGSLRSSTRQWFGGWAASLKSEDHASVFKEGHDQGQKPTWHPHVTEEGDQQVVVLLIESLAEIY